MAELTNEQLMDDIAKRAAAMAVEQLKPAADAQTSTEAQIEALRAQFADLLAATPDDHPFVRKMRFGTEASAKLAGSKFARWGLGVSDVEFMYDVLTAGKRAGLSNGPSVDLQNAFKAISEAYYLSEEEVARIDRTAMDGAYPRVPKVRAGRATQTRAMDTAESGFGSQLIGAQYVGDLWTAARDESRVFGLLDSFEATQATVYVPVEVDIPEMLLLSESTAANSSNFTTSKTGSQRVSNTPKKLGIHQMWSGEMEEDSIIPYVAFLRRQLAISLSYYTDSLVLNGDDTNSATGNINLDDADPADTKHYLAFDGIRHGALVDNTNNTQDAAGAVSLALLKTIRGMTIDQTYMHDWAHPTNPEDFVYVCDPETADNIANLDEVMTWKTMNGGPALLAGEVSRVIGHPVIAAMACKKTEADGKLSTTGSNNTKGQVVAFNRRGAKVVWRRHVKLEFERIPATDQNRLVATLRVGLARFTPTGAASGIEWVSVLRNITV